MASGREPEIIIPALALLSCQGKQARRNENDRLGRVLHVHSKACHFFKRAKFAEYSMMLHLEEFIQLSSSLTSPDALRRLYLKTLGDEGYQNAAFVTTRAYRLASVRWTHLPPGYTENYTSRGWDKVDPIIQYVTSARRPIHWQDIGRHAPITQRQKRFMEDCREMGVHSGVTIPIHGPGFDVDLIRVETQ